MGRASQECESQCFDACDHMLAVVEHEQHPTVLNPGDQLGKRLLGLKRYPERGRHSAWHQMRITVRGQINESDAVLIDVDQLLGQFEGEGRLSNPAGSD